MKIVVYDSCALIAYINHEKGWDMVHKFLRSTKLLHHVHWVNWCEFLYDLKKRNYTAKEIETITDKLTPVLYVERFAPETYVEEVARIKKLGRIAFGDACGLAYAIQENAKLFLTCDRKEIQPHTDSGALSVKVEFIRE